MGGRLRVRRLTLAPTARSEVAEMDIPEAAPSMVDCFLASEQMARVCELVHAATPKPRPSVHGVEDTMGSRFWALGVESDSDADAESNSDESMSTPDFIQQAQEVGFSFAQLIEAEEELNVSTKKAQVKEGSMANKIVEALVRHRTSGIRPWRGKLPPPRVSPPRTLGDAMASAKVCCKHPPSFSAIKARASLSKSSSPSWPLPQSEVVQSARSASCGNL